MLKKLIVCALACSALSANAAEQAFEWRFTGFGNEFGEFWAEGTVSGRFVLDDLNGDGVYTLPEVKSFSYNQSMQSSCGAGGAVTCTLATFDWNPDGKLYFSYHMGEKVSEGYFSQSIWVSDWDGQYFGIWGESYRPDSGEEFYSSHSIDSRTKLEISPVPEPQTYLMLGAGLLALAGIRRRALQAKKIPADI